ncbi:bifunctional 3,4-dihydroxy-2-butanone-4-phosphate synthase/GTP cyclohydrolase II [Clostridium saccharobutylicum]|uniref:Riboflavin biosynthesis protein RibBA n=1 Tax=Clostridium saccharobutylicum DSM 13864 TaxID=1345695 RepID=U5MNW6_CLOSA|nr:bifunctional 3,4-dihydroxy-2-butanone-4-phosphate synthase/GTP cyclohydrolase II [Clostridium saccharobutylicum]AGX42464.1 ribBA: riboflavin biosynthesis protein RibBA [Clostridium saccharobutylicum DSM 13864]AQR89749.1 riboflavin biosynthesis protein RibBA [Clostridium saccharobutylicum]AQR99651.1 riboflavin biosynthesis protein RibBA [Clostridium saccharobutylicum]AQS13637.1 riboflavin biosynthesis protein RibBA [Clostridium saccharobutylicum]MBA2906459.1 3,4-dihydroxy 2-butanone 4-phosph
MKFSSIEEGIKDLKEGKMIIVVDNEDRENEGDLVIPAEMATGENINFMIKYARGLVCAPIEEEIAIKLGLNPMVERNTDNHETAFTVAVDHKDTTTGISAFERAYTINKLVSSNEPMDFRRPGHIFPLIAKKKGVLERIGHTEASVDLAKLAGFKGAATICEIVNDDGNMARRDDLMIFAREHNLKILTISDLIQYRLENEVSVSKEIEAKLPTKYGDFKIIGFEERGTNKCHVALVKGDITTDEPVLTRIHSECLTGDALGSRKCDCGEQYAASMEMIAKEGRGMLLYMRQEGRGIGLLNKLKAYALQDKGLDTVDANLALGLEEDARDYKASGDMLRILGVNKVRLITNNPSKIEGLTNSNIEVVERVPIEMPLNENDELYLRTKKERMNHLLNI